MNGDDDLEAAQAAICMVIRLAITSEVSRLTKDRRKTTIGEVFEAAIAIGQRTMAEQQALFGPAIGGNLVRLAAADVRRYVQAGHSPIDASMAAFVLGAVLLHADS